MSEGVGGGPKSADGGAGDLSFPRRDFALSTRVKDGSESLGDVVDDEERDGGTFVSVRSGEGGGRGVGVESIACHSRWDKGGDRRKSGQTERGKRTILSRRQLELCSGGNVCLFVTLYSTGGGFQRQHR